MESRDQQYFGSGVHAALIIFTNLSSQTIRYNSQDNFPLGELACSRLVLNVHRPPIWLFHVPVKWQSNCVIIRKMGLPFERSPGHSSSIAFVYSGLVGESGYGYLRWIA